ncbi:hypothetical protein AAFF_G00115870 [Aldrovandia affinis]|uniref:Uncharacterized protein n=1 Tax=Aldrovandia affinis TaxID=143900 RepID=A0AAD7T1I0_9TELE|nr:hypothetical protein AAFF_G00115870 [Aldrovandia affinis]
MAPVLAYPDANWPFILDTDASNEAWTQLATLRAIDGEAGCLPLSPAQVQEEQERDTALIHVRKRPEWADVTILYTETRAYHSQWGGLKVLHRWWRVPGRRAVLLQLLVPRG